MFGLAWTLALPNWLFSSNLAGVFPLYWMTAGKLKRPTDANDSTLW
jgi:hypothetical protein